MHHLLRVATKPQSQHQYIFRRLVTAYRTPHRNMATNDNPGNFANRPKEDVKAAAQKGGEHSHGGGFASMDAEKQVCLSFIFFFFFFFFFVSEMVFRENECMHAWIEADAGVSYSMILRPRGERRRRAVLSRGARRRGRRGERGDLHLENRLLSC